MTKIPISRSIYARSDEGKLFFYIETEAITITVQAQLEKAFQEMSVGDLELMRAIKDPFEQLDRLGEMVPVIAKMLAEPPE
jgi:hypothetical protein